MEVTTDDERDGQTGEPDWVVVTIENATPNAIVMQGMDAE